MGNTDHSTSSQVAAHNNEPTRDDLATSVLLWLEADWTRVCGERWSPDERTLIHLVDRTASYAEAAYILTSVARRYVSYRFAPRIQPADVCRIIRAYADFMREAHDFGPWPMSPADVAAALDRFWAR